MLGAHLAVGLMLATPSLAPPQGPPVDPPPPQEGTLHIEVVDERGEGLFRVHVSLDATEEQVARAKGGAVRLQRAITDPDGFASLTMAAGQVRGLFVRPEGPGRPQALELAAFEPGEERELRVEVQVTPDLEIARRVVWDDSGEPVVGAVITGEQPSWTQFGAGPVTVLGAKPGGGPLGRELARTDEDGWFRVPVRSWHPLTAYVFAEGGSLRGLCLHDPDREVPQEELRLHRSAALRGKVSGDVPPELEVVAQFQGYGIPIAGRDPNNFLSGLSGQFELRCPVEGDGSYLLEGIPSQSGFLLQIRADGRVLLEPKNPPRLVAGGVTEASFRLSVGVSLSGVVRNSAGEPVPGVSVRIQAGGDRRKVFRSHEEYLRRATTNELGRFRFPSLQPARYEVGVLGGGRAAVWISVTQPVELASTDVEADLVLQDAHYVEGRVLSLDGDPVKLTLFASAEALTAFAHAQSGADGFFRVGPFPPGPVVLTGQSGRHWAHDPLQAPWSPFTVEAGATGVELRLQEGGSISGKAVDALTREPVPAIFQFADGRGSRSFGGQLEEAFAYGGLLPGKCTLVGMSADGRIGARVYEIGKGDARIDQELKLLPGARLQLVHRGEREYLQVEVRQGELVYDSYTLTRAEPHVLRAPVGQVQLRLFYSGAPGEPPLHEEVRTLELTAGELLELTFTEEER